MARALLLSAALHLILLVLIRPAPWAAPAEVLLQARLSPVAAPTTPVVVESPEPPVELPTPLAPALQPASAPSPQPPALSQPTPPPASDTGVNPPSPDEPRMETAGSVSAGRDEAPTLPLPEVPLLVDTRWYTAREVERRPEPLGEILPAYPEEARRRGVEGSVIVALHIDETGAVREVEILQSTPPGVFDAAVIAAYGQARFQPAARAGRPVRYIGRYRVLFELE